MYWDITSLATSQVGHQLLFSRFIYVTFESDNPQWLTDYGTLFYSTQYSWLPNLWQLFGKRKGHEWSHRQVWVVINGFVRLGEDLGSSWRKSLVKIHHKACQHTALLDVSLQLCTVQLSLPTSHVYSRCLWRLGTAPYSSGPEDGKLPGNQSTG